MLETSIGYQPAGELRIVKVGDGNTARRIFALSGAHTRAVAKCGLPLVSRAVETAGQVAVFVGRHADAQHLNPASDTPHLIPASNTLWCALSATLPNAEHDGFCYALLQKN